MKKAKRAMAARFQFCEIEIIHQRYKYTTYSVLASALHATVVVSVSGISKINHMPCIDKIAIAPRSLSLHFSPFLLCYTSEWHHYLFANNAAFSGIFQAIFCLFICAAISDSRAMARRFNRTASNGAQYFLLNNCNLSRFKRDLNANTKTKS